MSDDNFLSRWSRRKLASKATPAAAADPPAAGVVPAQAGTQSTSTAGPEDRPPTDVVPAKPAPAILKPGGTQPPLQSVESLTPESNFEPFMNAKVDPETRRQALKTLFTDPRFNVMDGLDVYIDDYSKPDPLPAGWLEKMHQYAYLGDRGERDREEAARAEAAAATPPAVPPAGNIEREQPLAVAPAPEPSHTPGAVSPPAGLRESAGKASG
ncbi:MAG: DUF3306 domain-containing protein [Pseudomonadota bacterium]|nr:DUF3306 domain-containing protein [Pseudomonadota bacterium]